MKDNTKAALVTVLTEGAKLVVSVGVTLVTKDALQKAYENYDARHMPLPEKKWWETTRGYNKRNGLS